MEKYRCVFVIGCKDLNKKGAGALTEARRGKRG
jgi:hypothetical protein